jgi:parallel beta helix pectate lyase-like protein
VHRATPAASLALLFAWALAFSGARAEEKREQGPAVLFVRAPVATDAGQAPPDGSEARPFRSLRAALAAAPAGAILRIDEGVFGENLTIARAVILMGRGAGRTRIVAADPRHTVLEVRGADRVEIYGVSIESAAVCAAFAGGAHRLQRIELHACAQAGLVGRGAQIELISSVISDVSGGREGRGIDLEGGSLEARKVFLHGAGRRGVVLSGAQGVLEDVEVRSSGLSALQATSGAEVRVIRGIYDGLGGAALYAGGSRLSVEGARVQRVEYGVLGFRGAVLRVQGGELTDYAVAGVAMVNSFGSVENVTIARGGTEAAISITRANGTRPVLLLDNRISHPGPMGVHVTESSVTARGNTITGARLDAEKDMGDAFYAVDSRLVIEQNVMRGNAGSGVAAVRTQVRLSGNGFIENGRAGVLLLDGSKGSATGNTFARNAKAGVELGEQSRATLTHNRFGGSATLDVDAWCGKGLAGTAEIGEGNLALEGVLRQRSCGE